MAYPEPLDPLEGEDAKELEKQIKGFKVSSTQRARIDALRARYGRSHPIRTWPDLNDLG